MKALLVRSMSGLLLAASLFAAPIDIFNTTGSFTTYSNDENDIPFWDRNSSDGNNCNIGYYLNSGAMTCSNEKLGTPLDTGLGLAGSPTTMSLNAGNSNKSNVNWTIDGGDYTFKLMGSITGASVYEVGYKIGDVLTPLFTSAGNTFGDVNFESIGADFSLYIKSDPAATGGGTFFSNDGSLRVAAFYNSAQDLYYFGFEDRVNTCTKYFYGHCVSQFKSDRDYNDMVISMAIGDRTGEEVPEPSTYALMGAGLAALGIYRRRRA